MTYAETFGLIRYAATRSNDQLSPGATAAGDLRFAGPRAQADRQLCGAVAPPASSSAKPTILSIQTAARHDTPGVR